MISDRNEENPNTPSLIFLLMNYRYSRHFFFFEKEPVIHRLPKEIKKKLFLSVSCASHPRPAGKVAENVRGRSSN
jgi:hypothetical protein